MINSKQCLKDIDSLSDAINDYILFRVYNYIHCIDITASIGQNEKYCNLWSIDELSDNIAIILNNQEIIDALYLYKNQNVSGFIYLRNIVLYGIMTYNYRSCGITIMCDNNIITDFRRSLTIDLRTQKYIFFKHSRMEILK